MLFGERAEALLTIDGQQQNSSPRRIWYNNRGICKLARTPERHDLPTSSGDLQESGAASYKPRRATSRGGRGGHLRQGAASYSRMDLCTGLLLLYNDDDIIYIMLCWDLFRTLKHRMAQLGQYLGRISTKFIYVNN